MAEAAEGASWHGSATHSVITPGLELRGVCSECTTGCPLCRGLNESRHLAPVGDVEKACDPSDGGSAAATHATLRGAASAENSEDAQNAEDEDDDVEATQDKMHEGMEEEGLDTIDVVCAEKLPALQPQPGQK